MSQTTADFYNRISQLYDAIADGGERKARELGLQLLNAQAGERILEIGFGTGHSLIALAEAVGESGHVSGVDIAEGMLAITSKRVERESLRRRVSLTVGEAPPLAYDDGNFDAVVLSFTLELFPLDTIPVLLSEIRRVLVPGGRLGVVSMASVRSDEKGSLLERTYIWMHTHFPHIVDCQPIDVERHLSDAGFQLVEDRRIDIFTMPVAAVVGVAK